MRCYVYKSQTKADTYIFLDQKDAFDKIPKPLLELFGEPAFVLEFDLTKDRKLAIADAMQVLANVEEQGYYLQMPSQNNFPA